LKGEKCEKKDNERSAMEKLDQKYFYEDENFESEDEISDKEYTPRLGSDYDKSELSDVKAEELYGDKFNTSFLKELKKLSDDRRKDLPKIVDPDRPAIEPEIGDSARTNKRSPVATRK
jgi:hypothetical protein